MFCCFCFCFFFLLRCPQRLMACGILTYGCLILIGLSMPHSKLLFSIFCLVAFWTCPNSNLPATAANRLHRKFFALPYVFQFASGSTSWNIAKSSSLEYGKVSWKVIWLPRMWNLLRAWWVSQINKFIKRFSIFLQVKLNYLCSLRKPIMDIFPRNVTVMRRQADKFQCETVWTHCEWDFQRNLPVLLMILSTLVVVCAGRAINIHRLLIISFCGQKLMLQLRLKCHKVNANGGSNQVEWRKQQHCPQL